VGVTVLDNFDGEAPATSPPANWTQSHAGAATVNGAQYVSSPYSMFCDGVTTWRTANRASSSGIGENIFSVNVRFSSTSGNYVLQIRDSSDNVLGGFYIAASADFQYYSNSGIHDSGLNYAINTWYNITIVLNNSAETYTMTFDGDTACEDVAWFTTGASADNIEVQWKQNCWFDDFQYDDGAPSGNPGHPLTAGMGCGVG